MDFYIASALSNALVSFTLGAFVFLKNKDSIINRTFSLYCLTLFLWSLFYFLWQISDTYQMALFWSRALMAGAIFIPITYSHFLFALSEEIEKKKNFLTTGYLIFLFFFLISFTPFFVESVTPKAGFSFWPNPGVLYHPFIIIWIFYVIYFVHYLKKIIKKFSGTKQVQLKYIFVATIIGFTGGSTNYLLWYDIPVPPFANWAISIYIAIVFYSILRHRFLDVRVALGRGLIYFLSFILVIFIGVSSVLVVDTIFPEVSQKALITLAIIVGVSLFKPIYDFFQNLGARYFYYTFYNYQKVLSDLGKNLTKFLDINRLASVITHTLSETMKLDRAVILIRDEKEGEYVIQKNVGFKEENGISLVKDNFLTAYLEKKQGPLVYEELSLLARDSQDEEEKKKVKKLQENMHRIEAALCLPLFMKDRISGMIVLGNKISGDPYFEQDIDLLKGLASQASIAFENAKLYSEVQDLSQNLEKKVDEQVRELKNAYKKLQKIDKTKTEFMSIVSHQLRTPLSIVKGHLSMLNEGVYDDDEEKKKKILNNISEANERLITLVNDVLNISRIQAGRVEIRKEKTDVVDVAQKVTERMSPSADEKGIDLVFHEPKESLPETEIDISKIENALLNLIDNAIKYTNEGAVEVFLEREDDYVVIKIKDSGEGMDKDELEKLFETFSRGGAGKKNWIQGAGLGLYIARQFVEMHGGKVWAESEGKNKGSQFYMKLPL